jgi:hypothetical protein
MARKKKHKLTIAKAKLILEEGKIRGKKLTAKQKRFFGWVAGGRKPRSRKKRR